MRINTDIDIPDPPQNYFTLPIACPDCGYPVLIGQLVEVGSPNENGLVDYERSRCDIFCGRPENSCNSWCASSSDHCWAKWDKNISAIRNAVLGPLEAQKRKKKRRVGSLLRGSL